MAEASADTLSPIPGDRDQLAQMLDVVLRVSSSLDLDSTLQTITDAAVSIAGAETASIYLRDGAGIFHAVASHGVPLERLQRVVLTSDQGLMAEMCRTGGPVQVTDFVQEVRTSTEARDEVTRLGAHATLGVPLLDGGDCMGGLYVARASATLFPTPTVQILQRFAGIAQTALQNARRFTDVDSERTRLQRYLDAIPEAVMAFDRDGRISLINETMQRVMGARTSVIGLQREDVLRSRPVYGSRPARLRYDPDEVFQRVLTTGNPEQGLMEMDNPAQTWEVYFSALRASNGQIEGVVSTMRDLTAPLELERERSRANLMTQLLDLSASLNSDLSVAVLMERVVEAAMRLVGAQAGTIGFLEDGRIRFRRFLRLGAPWADIDESFVRGEGAPGQGWQQMAPYVCNNCEQDPHISSNVRIGFSFRRMLDVPLIDRSGLYLGALEVMDPVVERNFGQMDVEALQILAHQATIALENARLSEMKDEFLSIVSHELKTPITSIKGFTQLLQRRLPAESLERSGRYLDIITQQSDRLAGLINHLLDLSRIQTGRFAFDTEVIDYGALIHDVGAEVRMAHADNSIVVTAPEHLTLVGNADRLRQVVVNLVDNGVKHGPPHGEIRITVQPSEHEVRTYVCDSGTGLPPGEEERIFGLYYQIRHSTGRSSQGLGLGLFITRQIIEEHGGRIWLDPADHTSFCFSLPAGEAPAVELGPVDHIGTHLAAGDS